MDIAFVNFIQLLIVLVGICVIAAWILSIFMFIEAARAKGHSMEKTGLIWFIGIFATPIVVGIYVAALPDMSANSSSPKVLPGDIPNL